MFVTEIEKYQPAIIPLTPSYFFNDVTLAAEQGGELVFDIESFPNYFLIAFKSFKTGLSITFAASPEEQIDLAKLEWVAKNFTLIGFNSTHYDMPMLYNAIHGESTERLHNVSNEIILGDVSFTKHIDLTINHIDLQEVGVGRYTALKTYAARMHVPRVQDLDYDPQASLTREQAKQVMYYCLNDLDITAYLYAELQPQIDLRRSLMKTYSIDLRSKSDAQIAEAIIGSELKKITGRYPNKPKKIIEPQYYYRPPTWLIFENYKLNQFVETIARTPFTINEHGSIKLPSELDQKLTISNAQYQFGIGGLHSMETMQKYISNNEYVLLDRDVASYYPNIILNQQLYPQHLGADFLHIYENIVKRRMQAKESSDKITSDGLKITINGSFGKFGSKYSILYSPDLLMQVTISGQLGLLMLIEAIENADDDIHVVSANTDGIVTWCPRNKYDQYLAHVYDWEERSGFNTEETEYASLWSRDVNNYIAIKPDGTHKAKGAYSRIGGSPPSRLGKNPVGEICIDAVIALLTRSTPVEDTIFKCHDLRKFLRVRKVNGGAVKDGHYIGKTIRWYYKKNEFGCIKYASNGNKVPTTDGAQPAMYLSDFPKDIDYQWYYKETLSMLKDIGYFGTKRKQLELF